MEAEKTVPADFIGDLGLLALGSRLRRASDRIMASGIELYRSHGLEFEPRWFPLFRLLADVGSVSVGEAARALGHTHAAVSQVATVLRREGLVETRRDGTDERRRLLSLTKSGRDLLPRLRPVWDDVHKAVRDVVAYSGVDLLAGLDGIEHALEAASLADRATQYARRRQYDAIEIVPFEAGLEGAFRALNVEWLEKHFTVEAVDLAMFEDPRKVILEPGGHILFAKVDGEIVGTCALLAQGDRFELIKMAVAERCRGRQIGKKLMNEALDVARRAGARAVFLVTNSIMLPAVSMYRKTGFRVTHSGPHPKYERGDLVMELDL